MTEVNIVPFNAIIVKAKESIDKTIYFGSGSIKGIEKWLPGKYKLNMFFKTFSNDDLINTGIDITFELSKEQATNLNEHNKGQITSSFDAGFRLQPNNNPLYKYQYLNKQPNNSKPSTH